MSRRWIVAGGSLIALIIGGIIWLAVSGAGNCPPGQHSVFRYYQPIITVVNKVPIVTEVPIYGCQR